MDITDPETIAAISGIGVALVREGYSQYSKRKTKRRQSGILNVMSAHSAMTDALRQVVQGSRFNRGVLLKCHNGGDVPNVNNPVLYSTAFVEDYKHPLGSAVDHWTQQRLDAEYILMLRTLSTRKVLTIGTSDMAKGTLRHLYEAQAIVGSRVCEVLARPNEYWYASFNYTDRFRVTSKEENLVRECISKLANVLQGLTTT